MLTLELHRGSVLGQMMAAFCQERLPDNITFNGERFNLTEAYDEFWTQLCDSPTLTKGHSIKLPNEGNLTDPEMLAIAKVLRRGWQDEHYFPKRIAPPLLEACFFNREIIEDVKVSADMLLSYIEPSHRATINQESGVVDTRMLQLLASYCPDTGSARSVLDQIREGDDRSEACKKAGLVIMVGANRRTVNCWTPQLVGLLELEEFNFLTSVTPIKLHECDIDSDLSLIETPHKLWHTFFYRWSPDKIDFYLKAVKNERLGKRCNMCLANNIVAKHLLSACNQSNLQLRTLHKETHDCVLKIILKVFKTALEARAGPYFSRGNDWKYLTMFGNYKYGYPEELDMLRQHNQYPHLLAFCTSPVKRALIVEPTVSWEVWMQDTKHDKQRKYESLCSTLRSYGYEVTMEVIMLGRRGVLSPDLYNLFHLFFGMTHQDISRVMEKISRKIITVSFNEYVNSRPSRV